MAIASPWFPVLVLALCLALGAAIATASPWYRALLAQPSAHRFAAIDGLRGFLALGVFFTHVMTTHGYYAFGRWDASFAPLYVMTGQAGVSLFFMITGFLFWTRVLRGGPLDARALYASRIRRLAPMYFVSVAAVLAVVAVLSRFALHEPLYELARELRPWLSFGFMDTGSVNGVKDAHVMNAVYWTLAYEWSFYLALPLLALFARGAGFALLVACTIFFGLQAPITLNFLAGALAAVAVQRGFLEGRLASPWLTPLPLAALAAVLSMQTAYAVAPIALMFAFFLFVVDGNSLFGLLRTRAARLLGTTSYSFYLLHGIVAYVAFRAIDGALPVGTMTAGQHWSVAAAAATAAVALSALTYRYVEHPFLAARAAPAAPSAAPAPVAVLELPSAASAAALKRA
jgi:peptidoglycan/LPS O-acetylase OafA/YrhL